MTKAEKTQEPAMDLIKYIRGELSKLNNQKLHLKDLNERYNEELIKFRTEWEKPLEASKERVKIALDNLESFIQLHKHEIFSEKKSHKFIEGKISIRDAMEVEIQDKDLTIMKLSTESEESVHDLLIDYKAELVGKPLIKKLFTEGNLTREQLAECGINLKKYEIIKAMPKF